MASRYSIHSHIPEQKFQQLLHGFLMDFDASTIAQVLEINRNTVNRYFLLLRERILEECDGEWVERSGFADKSEGQNNLFGILVQQGKIHARSLPAADEAFARELLADYGDYKKALDAAQEIGYRGFIHVHTKQYRLLESADVADCDVIEEFFGYVQQRLARFRGIHPSTFPLHIKECEWRFNHRGEDLYKHLLLRLRKAPLKAYE